MLSQTSSQSQSEENAAAHPRLQDDLTAEMSRLYSIGYSLLPLGGDDGKKPIVRFRDRARLPLSLVVDRMLAAGRATYGIRLEGLLVVDVDTDTPEARRYVEHRFGPSPCETRSGRGFHLYFRHAGTTPPAVRLPGLSIDFKAGPNEFVVGPHSSRPDGIVYRAEGRLQSPGTLPLFEDHDNGSDSEDRRPAKVGGRYPRGTRHKALNHRARQLALHSDSFDELLADLIAVRDWEIEQPSDFPDGKLERIALWYWDKRERGELWGGKNSVAQIHRSVTNELARRGEHLAYTLYGILVSEHGHKRNAVFAVVPDGLRCSGRLKAGRRQIYRAVKLLVGFGLLVLAERARKGQDFHLYQLGRANLEETKGERSKLTLVSCKGTHAHLLHDGLAA